ncbi:MAG: Smr/MutS family protein [Pseudomonadota bacterium]
MAETVDREPRSKSVLLQSAGITAMQRAVGEDAVAKKAAGPAATTPSKAQGRPLANPGPNTRSRVPPNGSPPAITPNAMKPATAATTLPQPTNLDAKTLRKVRSGRKAIEARLDLHGMRQHEAHAELRAFLFRCHAKGARWVMVITGKGRKNLNPAASHDDNHSNWNDHFGGRSKPGVLRDRVPFWLSEPEFRTIVIGYSQAAPQHGGEGALYIQLRVRKG